MTGQGPSGAGLQLRHGERGSDGSLDEVGRLLLNICTCTPQVGPCTAPVTWGGGGGGYYPTLQSLPGLMCLPEPTCILSITPGPVHSLCVQAGLSCVNPHSQACTVTFVTFTFLFHSYSYSYSHSHSHS